jgi:hypothetical protein
MPGRTSASTMDRADLARLIAFHGFTLTNPAALDDFRVGVSTKVAVIGLVFRSFKSEVARAVWSTVTLI